MDNLNTEPKLKFCRDCAHLIGVRDHTDEESVNRWKCGAKQNEVGYDLVSGRKLYRIPLCIDQRKVERIDAEACRAEGLWFEMYVREISKEFFHSPPLPPRPSPKKQITLSDLGIE